MAIWMQRQRPRSNFKGCAMAEFEYKKAVIEARKAFDNTTNQAVILKACACLMWLDGKTTECPKENIPTAKDLIKWFRDIHGDKIAGTMPGIKMERTTYGEWVEAQANFPLHAFGVNLYLRDLMEYNRKEIKAGRVPPMVQQRVDDTPQKLLKDYPAYKPILATRNQWQQASKNGLWPDGAPNPVRVVVEAWQGRATQIFPFVPRKKAQMVLFDDIEEQEGKRLIEAQEQQRYTPPQTELEFPEMQRNDIVASWLLDLYRKVGGMVSPGRGAPYPLRLFVGGLLHTPINQRDGEFHFFPLGTDEVIRWLHPDVAYVKRQQWDSFRNGLKAINDLGWVSVPGVGSVKVLDASVIPEKPTDPICQFIVRVPPAASKGATINWERLCAYGRDSASLYRAYLTACDFMHRSAHSGHPITQMIGRAIIDKDGNPIRIKKGKKRVVKRSKTGFEPNPATRYVKGLNKAQLAQAIGLDSSNRHNRRNALEAFERLAYEGVIDLQSEGKGHGVKYHIYAPNKWQNAQAEVIK